MDTTAVLALIGDLYGTVGQLRAELARVTAERDELLAAAENPEPDAP